MIVYTRINNWEETNIKTGEKTFPKFKLILYTPINNQTETYIQHWKKIVISKAKTPFI